MKNIKTLQELERDHIKQVFSTVGNKTKAAKLLGIDRRTLYRKIKEYKLDIKEDLVSENFIDIANAINKKTA